MAKPPFRVVNHVLHLMQVKKNNQMATMYCSEWNTPNNKPLELGNKLPLTLKCYISVV